MQGNDDDEVLVIDGLGHHRVFTRRTVKHMVVGSILGFFLSLTLSSILYEISKWDNGLFVAADVVVLFAASLALFMKQFRAHQNLKKSGAVNTNSMDEPEMRMLSIVRVGAACVGTGAICVLLLKLISSLPAVAKFFLILNISAAHCYLLCMGSVEFFNSVVNGGTPLIARQLYTVVIASLGIGCLSGFLFGVADVEKNYESFAWEEWVAAAVCILSGAAVGHANAVAVDDQMEIAFDPLPMDETATAAAASSLPSDSTSAVSLSTVAAARTGSSVFGTNAGSLADDE